MYKKLVRGCLKLRIFIQLLKLEKLKENSSNHILLLFNFHLSVPLWVTQSGHIYLPPNLTHETYSVPNKIGK